LVASAKRNDPCPCGSGKKYKRCCLDSERNDGNLQDGGKTSLPADDLTIMVKAGSKIAARRIPSASPLPTSMGQGYAAEAATREAATLWGLPDFVYEAGRQRVGPGTRELGDGILIVGELGIVLQVKSRAAPSNEPEKERRWLEKNITQALAQGTGTIRQLNRQPAALTNLRGRTIDIGGADYRWLIVVVIDHPGATDGLQPTVGRAHPAVVMLRRDWEFLFDQLKSTRAVGQYCERVADEPIELGAEPLRYYELARADAEAEPEILDGPGSTISAPLLPLAPAGSEDLEAHYMIREILEAIASPRSLIASETDRLRALAELDGLPVGHRANIGRFLLTSMDEVLPEPVGEIVWRMRSLRGPAGQAHLGFAVSSRTHSQELQDLFGWWVQLRHHDALTTRGDVDGLTTVGVLLTPRAGNQKWDTTMAAISGDPEFSEQELATLREIWPTQHAVR
jgi:SEC-C motif